MSRPRFAPASRIRRLDALIFLALAIGALALYAATLLPGIGSGDTAEFQRVAPTLGIAHPTGYPLYTILGWLWSQLPLGDTPAWRMNLLSAVAAALAVGVVYLVARASTRWPRSSRRCCCWRCCAGARAPGPSGSPACCSASAWPTTARLS